MHNAIAPTMTIIAGPNGAGKSTLRELWRRNRPLGQIIDSDAIARENKLSDVAAGRETIRRVERCIEDRLSFALETTLSGHLIFEQIQKAKDTSFQVHLLYISLSSPFAHQKRVEQRVLNGGHAIPPGEIERRYYRSHENLPKAISLSDYADIFSNGSKCVLIAQFVQGKAIYHATEMPSWAKHAMDSLL